MLAARLLDEKFTILLRTGKIAFVAPHSGHEAAQIGLAHALQRGHDWFFPYYRDAGAILALGVPLKEMFGHALATLADPAKGRQMPGHFGSKSLNAFTPASAIASHVPPAAGAAISMKLQNTRQVSVCTFGDGATSEGDWYAGVNIAAVQGAPAIFVCENNKYGMGTSQKRAMSIANIAKKAEGYGMAGEFVDGMDVMAVRDATLRAIERARKDGSPTLLEIRAYRYMGHSMSDPGKYRSTEEIKKYQERDPITLFQDSLKEAKVFTDKDFEEMNAKATEMVEAAVKFADESPFPDESELMTDVLA